MFCYNYFQYVYAQSSESVPHQPRATLYTLSPTRALAKADRSLRQTSWGKHDCLNYFSSSITLTLHFRKLPFDLNVHPQLSPDYPLQQSHLRLSAPSTSSSSDAQRIDHSPPRPPPQSSPPCHRTCSSHATTPASAQSSHQSPSGP